MSILALMYCQIALFLKRVVTECPSNDFSCHDLQFVMIIMNIRFVYFVYFRLIMFNYVLKLLLLQNTIILGFRLLWIARVNVSLGGAAIIIEVLHSISIGKQVLPLCLTFECILFSFMTIGFTMLK